MYFYRSKKQKLYDPELGQHVSFGIGVWKPFAAAPVLFIPDVSLDGKAVRRLALRCTLCQLDPLHLWDVVEDFIG